MGDPDGCTLPTGCGTGLAITEREADSGVHVWAEQLTMYQFNLYNSRRCNPEGTV